MKVFVADKYSHKFLFSYAAWTDREEDALDFESVERAQRFCFEHKLEDALLIVQENDLQTRSVLPAFSAPLARSEYMQPGYAEAIAVE